MITIYTIHAPTDRLASVISEMEFMGAPTIRVVDCGDHYIALEGSHRVAAAHALDLMPVLDIFAQDDEIDISQFDWFDAANWAETEYSASEVVAEIYSPQQARSYSFEIV